MLIAGFPAGPWGTNCYVVATGPGAECVVVDPGKDAADGVAEVVREHRLKPVAVLVTHGHIDHMWCVARSRARTTPPPGSTRRTGTCCPTRWPGCPAETAGMLLGGGYEFAEPDDVARARRRRRRSSWPACELRGRPHARATPAGSVTFRTPYARAGRAREVMFSGDLLFAGSIGRTDLPGGDHPTMLRSLRGEGAAAARRHRGAARPRRADHDRPRARHQPVPARTSTRSTRRPCHARALRCPTSSTPRRASPSYLPPRLRARSARSARPWRRPRVAAGYGYVETPVFEDTSLFVRGVGESTDVVTKEMYTFTDRGGRSLTLRPEGTAGVMRP